MADYNLDIITTTMNLLEELTTLTVSMLLVKM